MTRARRPTRLVPTGSDWFHGARGTGSLTGSPPHPFGVGEPVRTTATASTTGSERAGTSQTANIVKTGHGGVTPLIELLGFEAWLFAGLPGAATFVLAVRGCELPLTVTSSGRRWRAVRAAGGVVFERDEWAAMTLAAEADRASPAALIDWAQHKIAQPYWVLKPGEALGGVYGIRPLGRGQRWTIGRVARAYGAELAMVSE